MRKKFFGFVFITVLMFLSCTVTALAANAGGGVVTATALNLRQEPDTGSAVLDIVPGGSPVVVRARINDDWFKVWYSGREGYVSAEYLGYSWELHSDFGTGTINGTRVRMRILPTLDAEIMGHYDTGTQMQITGVAGAWYRVVHNGVQGYVHSDYMRLTSQNGESYSGDTQVWASSSGQTIVDTAMKYLGVPYVWAGTSPSGFDCSGLVYYVYQECGYATNRTAASLYQNGEYVDKASLQIGDVICFTSGSYGSIGHCGIYIGDGNFIHASSGTGYVTITSLSESYYVNHYYGARRIV